MYTINFIGHCEQDGHDKIWGFVTVGEDQLYNFWGRRGKKLAFQKHPNTWENSSDLQKKANTKCRPYRSSGTYVEVPISKIEEIVPNFIHEFEMQLSLAKLFDKFRGKKIEEDEE